MKHSMWNLIHPAEAEIIARTPGLADLAARIAEGETDLGTYAAEIDRARDDYAMGSDDDIEIDDRPAVSAGDDGVWIAAWVWVRFENNPDDEEEDDNG